MENLSKNKIDIDWASLPFGYYQTEKRFVSNFKNGKWDDGCMTTDATVVLNESAGVLQYCQACFEGMKAYRTKSGDVVIFRPEMNAKRMFDSAKRVQMPQYPVDKFIDAVVQVVKENIDYVPPFGTGASLYIRPVMFATDATLKVKPSEEFQFRVFASPVGSYFKKGNVGSINLKISEYDRCAPNGTGHVKAGLNYAMSFFPYAIAREEGFDESLYLDSKTHTMIEEAGGANVFFVTKDNKIVTPNSKTILPSVIRQSVMELAKDLGYVVEEREVFVSELENFVECGLCGTAVVISSVATITNNGKVITFENSKEAMGPVTKKLYDTLLGIQFGEVETSKNWLLKVN